MSKQTEAMKRWVEIFAGDWHDEIVSTEWADRANQAVEEMRQAIAEAEQPAQTCSRHAEAERLADLVERHPSDDVELVRAAAELRRLVSFNQQLMDEVARLNKEALHKLAAESLNEGLRLDDWAKIGCVNHDCDQCKALAEQPAQQEPVAWSVTWDGVHCGNFFFREQDAKELKTRLDAKRPGEKREVVPLYTTPQAQPAREPLTPAQKIALAEDWFAEDWAITKAVGMMVEYEMRIAHGITKGNT